jgi:hypothetical protein
MATAQAPEASPGKAIVPRAASPVNHRSLVPEASECQPAERPYPPDQMTIVLLVGCVLLILAMNLFDVITGILNW